MIHHAANAIRWQRRRTAVITTAYDAVTPRYAMNCRRRYRWITYVIRQDVAVRHCANATVCCWRQTVRHITIVINHTIMASRIDTRHSSHHHIIVLTSSSAFLRSIRYILHWILDWHHNSIGHHIIRSHCIVHTKWHLLCHHIRDKYVYVLQPYATCHYAI